VAGQGAGRKVSSNLTITGALTDISTSGDTVVGQTNKWNALSSQVKSALNYVIVEIGLNDMTSETLENDVVLFNSYQTLISAIRTDAPNSKIILSKMTPAHSRFINIYGKERGDIAYNNWIELNDAIDRLLFIGANTSVSYHVNIMGDDYGNLISEYDTGDQIHPNLAGGKVIAWSWLTGILK
jgi:lysophospholipase L1-like esterase